MRIETHVHTRFSKDSLLPLWLLYRKCRRKKIDAIAITDHNRVDGGLAFFKKYNGKHLAVIPGSEIMTESGEIIGLFLKENIPQGLSVSETIRLIKEQGGVVYLPHPYDIKRKKTVLTEEAIRKNASEIELCECWNGRNIEAAYGEQQIAVVNDFSFIPVVGSDAHTIWEIGRNYNTVDTVDVSTPDNFVSAFRKSTEFCKQPCIKSAHKITKFVKLTKLLFGGKFGELYRTITRKLKK